jgi:hypothetical protein
MVNRFKLLAIAGDMVYYDVMPNLETWQEMTLEEQDSLIYSFQNIR